MNTLLNKLNKKKSGKKGFTLMEMLIVVAIIAILIAIAIPTFTNALNKARQATDEANLRAYYSEKITAYMLGEDGADLPANSTKDLTEVEVAGSTYTLQAGHYTIEQTKSSGSQAYDNFKIIYKSDKGPSVTMEIPGGEKQGS